MLYNLEQFTIKYVYFTTEEIFLLADIFKPHTYQENDFVIKKGQYISNIYFLNYGVLKSYIQGNEREVV
ncbi:MAG: hypothetical protein ACOVLC_00545 [Flavobacterium sp.]